MPVKKLSTKKPSPAKAKAGKKPVKKSKSKIPPKLVKYLEDRGIDHEILEHKTVYTAIDAAQTLGKKMGEIAKTLYVKADKDYFVVILPADYNLDFKKLATCLSAQSKKPIKVVKIPGETIMQNALKIKAGAMHAFGSLYKLPVVVDKGLVKAKKAVFSAGSFNHSVQMAVKDFISLEGASLGSFGKKKTIKKSVRQAQGRQKVMKQKRGKKK